MAKAKIIAGSAKASRRRSRKKATAIQARRKKEFLYRGFTMEQLTFLPSGHDSAAGITKLLNIQK